MAAKAGHNQIMTVPPSLKNLSDPQTILQAILAVITVIGVITGIAFGSSNGSSQNAPESAPSPSSTASSTPEPEPTPTSTPTPEPEPEPEPESDILQQLAQLDIKGRAPKTGYDRALFGQRWSDDVTVEFGHNGCDTRNDILRRDLRDITVRPNTNDCVIETGFLDDPFTGNQIYFERGVGTSNAVQIDHIVPLSDAWQKGAQQWDADKQRNFANDPINLLAVDGPSNASKGDSDFATWRPPNKAFHCDYAAKIVTVKYTYDVWVTQAEHDALKETLTTCNA